MAFNRLVLLCAACGVADAVRVVKRRDANNSDLMEGGAGDVEAGEAFLDQGSDLMKSTSSRRRRRRRRERRRRGSSPSPPPPDSPDCDYRFELGPLDYDSRIFDKKKFGVGVKVDLKLDDMILDCRTTCSELKCEEKSGSLAIKVKAAGKTAATINWNNVRVTVDEWGVSGKTDIKVAGVKVTILFKISNENGPAPPGTDYTTWALSTKAAFKVKPFGSVDSGWNKRKTWDFGAALAGAGEAGMIAAGEDGEGVDMAEEDQPEEK